MKDAHSVLLNSLPNGSCGHAALLFMIALDVCVR